MRAKPKNSQRSKRSNLTGAIVGNDIAPDFLDGVFPLEEEELNTAENNVFST
jgi:hypothetical protein